MDVLAVGAPVPTDEAERLADLYAYEILDSDPEEPFDDLVQLATEICGTPWAVVNFIDEQRQWTKAVRGLDGGDTPREVAFCPHTIVAPGGFLLVEDPTSASRATRWSSTIRASASTPGRRSTRRADAPSARSAWSTRSRDR